MATAACPITDVDDVRNPSVVKVVCGADGRALMFSRAAIPHVRDGTIEEGVRKGLYWRHIGIYGYRREFLMRLVKTPPCALEEAEKLEQLRALWIGCRMRVLPASDVGVGVDTPEDVARIEALLRDRA